LTTSFPRFEGDIPGRFVYDLAAALATAGNRVTVLAACYPGTPREQQIGPVRVVRIGRFLPNILRISPRSSALRQVRETGIGKLRIIILFVLQVFYAVKIARDIEVDVLHSHWLLPQGLSGSLAAAILGKPHVVSIHGGGLLAAQEIPLKRGVLNFIASRTSCFACVSRYLARLLFILLSNNAARRPFIVTIPMGVEAENFQNLPNEHLKDGPTVLFVGRLEEKKGAGYLLEAMQHLFTEFPDTDLRIIGDGSQRAALEEKARELGIAKRVRFLGFLPSGELPSQYASSDIVVVPSVAEGPVAEGLGLVAVESGLSARAVVATRVGGLVEVVEDGKTGLLVSERSPLELQSALESLLADPLLRKKLSKRARLRCSLYSLERIAEIYEAAFRNVTTPTAIEEEGLREESPLVARLPSTQ